MFFPIQIVMDKIKEKLGIDVSKATVDCYTETLGHSQYINNEKGWKELVSSFLADSYHVVMEATGTYHYGLAVYLYEQGIAVSVVNPLVIKRFIQMKLQRNKTDKSDARMIYEYACHSNPDQWQPDSEYVETSKNYLSSLELYARQSTMLKNRLHSLTAKGIKRGRVITSLKRQIRQVQHEIDYLEEDLEVLVKANEPELYTALRSIQGIGKKTAMLLIANTNGFKDFDSSKQVSAFFGLAPTHRESGSSIRGRSRISKKGNPRVRSHLFLCSFTASQCNPQCRALYQRIIAKGKSKKLALIAVANKLIKQAYGISKSGLIYDPYYRSTMPKSN